MRLKIDTGKEYGTRDLEGGLPTPFPARWDTLAGGLSDVEYSNDPPDRVGVARWL